MSMYVSAEDLMIANYKVITTSMMSMQMTRVNVAGLQNTPKHMVLGITGVCCAYEATMDYITPCVVWQYKRK